MDLPVEPTRTAGYFRMQFLMQYVVPSSLTVELVMNIAAATFSISTLLIKTATPTIRSTRIVGMESAAPNMVIVGTVRSFVELNAQKIQTVHMTVPPMMMMMTNVALILATVVVAQNFVKSLMLANPMMIALVINVVIHTNKNVHTIKMSVQNQQVLHHQQQARQQ